MSVKLRTLIRAVRAAKTAGDERVRLLGTGVVIGYLAYDNEDLIFVNDPGPVETAIRFNFLILYLFVILFIKSFIEQFLLPLVKLLFLNFKLTLLSIISNIPTEE